MRKTFFRLFIVPLLFGVVSLSDAEMVVSLKQDTDVALPKIKVDIHLTDGKGVAGYNMFLVYDPAVLKYIDTIHGDYPPTGGIFIRPALGHNDTYELQLSIDETTTTGQSVVFGAGGEAQTLSLSEFFFKVPDPTESGPLPRVSNDDGISTSTLITSDLKYQAVSVLRSAPLAVDGNGTLASLSFDVLNPDMPMVVHLVGGTLFGADDTELQATLHNNVATFKKPTTDVNADGFVNILDLTRVAAAFGAPITPANRNADVNADGKINILDLVLVSQGFGQSVMSVVYTTELTEVPVDTSVETDIESVSQTNPSEPVFQRISHYLQQTRLLDCFWENVTFTGDEFATLLL